MRKLLILFGFISLFVMVGCSNNTPDFGYVSIRINPKIDILLDSSQNVESFIVLNEEAEILLAGEDLNGKNVFNAIETILDLSIATGYIDVFTNDNVIAVFASDTSDTNLQSEVESHIQTYLSGKAIAAAVLSQLAIDASTGILAETHDVPLLHAKLIQTYLGLHPKETESKALEYSYNDLHGLLQTEFDAVMEEFQRQREAAAQAIKELYLADNENVLSFFLDGVAQGLITLPDISGLKERFLAHYDTEIAKIDSRNTERTAFLEAKESGSIEGYIVGEFEFALSSQNWPSIVNYYNIDFLENGTYFESWSITSRFDGQTMTSDYIGSWQIVDGRLSLSGSPLFRFFVSNGTILAYNQEDELLMFHKVDQE
jgi:hypothetical protein